MAQFGWSGGLRMFGSALIIVAAPANKFSNWAISRSHAFELGRRSRGWGFWDRTPPVQAEAGGRGPAAIKALLPLARHGETELLFQPILLHHHGHLLPGGLSQSLGEVRKTSGRKFLVLRTD